MQHIQLPRKPAAISGIDGHQTGVAKSRHSIGLASLRVSAIVLSKLIAYVGKANVVVKPWAHLKNLALAEPEFLPCFVELFLGVDVYAAIIGDDVQKGGLLSCGTIYNVRMDSVGKWAARL